MRVKQDKDVWFGVNPLNADVFTRFSGRGYERDVMRWAALYNDLDVKKDAFKSIAHGREFIEMISGFTGQYPSAIIHSGHGLQPLWPIEDGDLDTPEKWERAYTLARRFRRFAADVARQHFNAKLDTVGDLARVLRVPGTTNHKDPDNPVPTACEEGAGGPLTLDEIEAFLDEWAQPIDSDKPVKDQQGNFAQQVSDPYEWTFVGNTCPYVRKMVEGWRTDKPKSGNLAQLPFSLPVSNKQNGPARAATRTPREHTQRAERSWTGANERQRVPMVNQGHNASAQEAAWVLTNLALITPQPNPKGHNHKHTVWRGG